MRPPILPLLCGLCAAAPCTAQLADFPRAPEPNPAAPVGRITITDKHGHEREGGTCFWISPDCAVTCWHIVLNGPPGCGGFIDMAGGGKHRPIRPTWAS
jgi:hypothetical protein